MQEYATSIGLDVHARSISACAFDPMTGEVTRASFPYDPSAVAEWALSFDAPKAVYESGVTGFHLCRALRALGLDCVVGAVSRMQKPSADRRRKTDRRDAEFLARLLATRNVVEVDVPDEECEAARDLSRALEDAREDLQRAKQRLLKFLLRHGLVFDERTPTGARKGNWTRAWWSWCRAISFAEPDARTTFEHYKDEVRRLEDAKRSLERAVAAAAGRPRWKPRVDALRCLKGIDVATAHALVAEAGDFSRFRGAPAFAAWCGLVPSEHSSGEGQSRGGITKAGNRHLRRSLVEAAWHYLNASPHSKDLAEGQAPDPAARRHAAKGVRRLVGRRASMLERGVHKNKANVATARELACWAWAIGCMAEGA